MNINNALYGYLEETQKRENILEREKNYSEPEKIFDIKSGCPICNSLVKGNRNMGFYCDECNVIFTEKNLAYSKKIINLNN